MVRYFCYDYQKLNKQQLIYVFIETSWSNEQHLPKKLQTVCDVYKYIGMSNIARVRVWYELKRSYIAHSAYSTLKVNFEQPLCMCAIVGTHVGTKQQHHHHPCRYIPTFCFRFELHSIQLCSWYVCSFVWCSLVFSIYIVKERLDFVFFFDFLLECLLTAQFPICGIFSETKLNKFSIRKSTSFRSISSDHDGNQNQKWKYKWWKSKRKVHTKLCRIIFPKKTKKIKKKSGCEFCLGHMVWA